jgi:hypothetical protein
MRRAQWRASQGPQGRPAIEGARKRETGTVGKEESPPETACRLRQAQVRAAPNGARAKADIIAYDGVPSVDAGREFSLEK